MSADTFTADGSALSDHADFVRIVNEGGASRRGANFDVTGRHGEFSDYDKPYNGTDILLEVGLKKTSTYQHLSELQKMLGATTDFVRLVRVNDYYGTVRADIEMLQPPQPTQNRFVYLFQLRNPDGFWEDSAVTTSAAATSHTFTTSGNRPINDMRITFAGPGTATNTTSGWPNQIMTWSGAGTCIVEVGDRTVRAGGSAVEYDFEVNDKWWMRFIPDTAVSLSSTVNITVDYRNKWA